MTRSALPLFLLLAAIPATTSWAVDEECSLSFRVEADGHDFDFVDQYVFQEGQGIFPVSGPLSVGGIPAAITVARIVQETRVRIETRTREVIVDGRTVTETYEVEVPYVVSRTVYERLVIDLPAIKGTWYSFDLCKASWWSFFASRPTGFAFGWGTTQQTDLSGSAIYFGLSPITSGYYHLSGSANPAP